MSQIPIQQNIELAVQHYQSGRFSEAELLFREILAIEPDHIVALYHLGSIAAENGKPEVAEQFFRRVIAIKPEVAEVHARLAVVLKDQNRREEAVESYRRSIALDSRVPRVHNNLGNVLNYLGRSDEAMASYRTAIALNGNYGEAHSNLGRVLRVKGNHAEALASFEKAIALNPTLPEAHNSMGTTLRDMGRAKEAIAALRKAIELRPDFPEAWNNLGTAFKDDGQLDEAIIAYRKSVALRPDYAEGYSNLGNCLKDDGQIDEAIAACRKAIELNPKLPGAHSNLGLSLLMRGEFEEGWRENEWRWQSKLFTSPSREFTRPLWDGAVAKDAVLLLHAEQGFGDAIHFVRYVSMAAERVGKVVVECHPELCRLFRSSMPDVSITAWGDPLPAFDFQCPFLTLPKVFNTRLETIPNQTPYLRASEAAVARWKSRLGTDGSCTKVGLVWAGSKSHVNDRRRSMKLARLAPLANVPGVHFFGLQTGESAAEAKSPPAGLELIDFTADLTDFAETAALIANLDLIIAVDTAVVHLAGALGKPVWTLLAYAADWRWMTGREDTPWYPTMRLFRQSERGNWDDVVGRVEDVLRRLKET